MGLVKMSGVVPSLSAPVPWTPPANFADATWSEVIRACQENVVPDTWAVGDQKAMSIGGTDYLIDIIGKNHDTYYDGKGSGTAPLTFQTHDIYTTAFAYNPENAGNVWKDSAIRISSLPSVIPLMPYEVQEGIKQVNKLTASGSNNSTIYSTSDKLFLLSEAEVFSTSSYSFAGEGSQYEYYAAGNSALKTTNGTARDWWLRGPHKSASNYVCITNNAGGATSLLYTYTNYVGTSFAFCF